MSRNYLVGYYGPKTNYDGKIQDTDESIQEKKDDDRQYSFFATQWQRVCYGFT